METHQINRVLKDVHRITVAAGMTLGDSIDLHLRALISAALMRAGKDRETAAALLRGWGEAAAKTVEDPESKIRRVTDGKRK